MSTVVLQNDQRIEILQQQLDQVSEELSSTQDRLSASQEQRITLEEQLIGAKEETSAMKTEAETAHEELSMLYKKRDERDFNIKQVEDRLVLSQFLLHLGGFAFARN